MLGIYPKLPSTIDQSGNPLMQPKPIADLIFRPQYSHPIAPPKL
jgi:hypothetical protein